MKRFTDTEIWSKPWFRRCPPKAKCLWGYLLSNCDHSGVIDPDWELISFCIGDKVSESDLELFNGNVSKLGRKLLIPEFVSFQYGTLSHDCKPHAPVFAALKRNGLCVDSEGIAKPIDGLSKGFQSPQEKEKEKEGEKDKETDTPLLAMETTKAKPRGEVILEYLNRVAGRQFRPTETNLSFINARLAEPGVDLEGVRVMIDRQVARWKGTSQEEYLRPETLFNKTKFDSYYAARSLPIANEPANGAPKGKTLLQKELEANERMIARL